MKTNHSGRFSIEEGNKLFNRGNRKKALSHFKRLRELYPKNSGVWLHSAFLHDRMGLERQAIPLYKKSISLGLNNRELRDALVCLSSSFINIGRPKTAIGILRRAQARFPEDIAMKLFMALAFYEAGHSTQSVRLLAMTILNEKNQKALNPFRKVLKLRYKTLKTS